MPPPPKARPPDTSARDLLYLSNPSLWPAWPVLPVVRRRVGCEPELGILVDLWRLAGIPGFSATVFLTNVLLVPRTLTGLLALPREVFDSSEEVIAAGWAVD